MILLRGELLILISKVIGGQCSDLLHLFALSKLFIQIPTVLLVLIGHLIFPNQNRLSLGLDLILTMAWRYRYCTV